MTERKEQVRESYQPKAELKKSFQPTPAKPAQGNVRPPSGGSNVQPPPEKKK